MEWQPGRDDFDLMGFPSHRLTIGIWQIVSPSSAVGKNRSGPLEGHMLAETSPLQKARIADTPLRLQLCRQAINERDFDILANVTELDCQLMHAVMITSTPPLLYWQPATQLLARTIQSWRKSGQPVCYTIDAGPNVHVLCPALHYHRCDRPARCKFPASAKATGKRSGGTGAAGINKDTKQL